MTGNSDSTPRPTTPRDLTAGQPVVTMIGGGQLARMTHQAAIALGQTLRVLSGTADEPAAQVSPDVVLGSHTDLDALRRAAVGSHALTFDHEHVPTEHLDILVAEGVNVQPPPTALIYAQDKLAMRRKLAELGAPVPAYAEVTWAEDVVKFGAEHGWPVVIKAVRGGYDGRGVWITDDSDEAERIVTQQLDKGVSLIVEEKVEMRRELSAMVARSPFGQGATWPVVETVQRHGQCAVVLAPAPALPDSVAEAAEELALRIASELGVVGAMAVELFETTDGALVVNELAMRPHNSGHWTMDGARTSQFEQHLRAVLDYPLGDTAPLAPITVMANVLGAPTAPEMSMDERVHHLFARMPDAKIHLYGKGEREDRKIGHVNIVGGPGSIDDPEYVARVRERAERAAHWLSHAEWTDGWDVHGE
ncbi:5-(carboxyamino)imidazole ribonucleotide synthase [Rhodococcus opacus]|nr:MULTISPECIES: 5-(carboxyamino)imidazole ribonucleotide synthase [Rhodococcus]ELB93371.1 phosphoribosylaminoimidazole carboxylase ATPase subunit [Rhodococcus wratislaviensis IFP 2016]MBA8960219.1 5-(carboxyamino)imidazole ribonucleotide synthase [Rhodococcus opacus]MBP2205784.1 5-(carboxyamino)imidazole ribonucleotide synthase [Rhodococcus opacus]MDI9936820.1 5-(carboxyamino)imidazole ribonucleotide synthase [Rhodococcus sp. IEGM 1351]MDJ0416042.1 5-(carboxyamino)imidazole ribonucleotide syn